MITETTSLTAMGTQSTDVAAIDTLLSSLGLAIKSSAPVGDVRENWPSIKYTTQLFRKDRLVWEGEYRLGIGHVKIPKRYEDIPIGGDVPVFNTLRENPGCQLKDKMEHAIACALLARVQKVSPELSDVIYSLLSDSEAYNESFEDWCGNLGYDSDSIKARGVYDACIEIGRKLSRAFSAAEIEELRKAFQDY